MDKVSLLKLPAAERADLLMKQPAHILNRLVAEICLNWRYRDQKYYAENEQEMRWDEVTQAGFWMPVPITDRVSFDFTMVQAISIAVRFGLTVNFAEPDYNRTIVVAAIMAKLASDSLNAMSGVSANG